MTDSTIISFEETSSNSLEKTRQLLINGEVAASVTTRQPGEAPPGTILSTENLWLYQGSLATEVDVQEFLYRLLNAPAWLIDPNTVIVEKDTLPPLSLSNANFIAMPGIDGNFFYSFDGSVSLNGKAGQLDWSITNDGCDINVVMGNNDVVTLVDVASLFGLGDDLESALPDDGLVDDLLNNLGLQQFNLKVSDDTLVHLEIIISTQEPLQLLDDKITLDPTLHFTCPLNPASGKLEPVMDIKGQWMLDGSQLDVSASSKSGDLIATLATGQELNVTGLLALIPELDDGVKEDLQEANLVFSVLDMQANYIQNDFYLKLALQSDWVFDIGITTLQLAKASLLVDYKGGGDSPGIQKFALDSVIVIGGVDLNLSMDYTQSDSTYNFEGSIDQTVNIGEVVEDLAETFSGSEQEFPDALKKFELNSFVINFTSTKLDPPETKDGQTVTTQSDGLVTCDFTIGSTQLGLRIPIGSHPSSNEYVLVMGGEQPLELILSSVSDEQLEGFTAYLSNNNTEPVSLRSILPDFDWLPDIELDPFTILYASVQDPSSPDSSADNTTKLMAMELETPDLKVQNIPAVGGIIPDVVKAGIESVFIGYSTGPLTADGLAAINARQEGVKMSLLDAPPLSQKGMNKGLTVVINALLGVSYPLVINLGGGDSEKTTSTSDDDSSPAIKQSGTSTTSPSPQKKGSTQPVKKKLGPVTVDSVELGFKNGNIQLLMDASISISGLNLGLMGLSISIPLDGLMNIDISGASLGLDGLFLNYNKGAILISGAMLRLPLLNDLGEETGRYEYIGQISIITQKLGITGLGAYSKMENGDPSAFIYASLLAPLGAIGPFLFEGIALGMGYNRGINPPDVNSVNTFPLVTALYGSGGGGSTGANVDVEAMKEKFAVLSKYLPMKSDQYMVAAGLKVTAFKMIECIAVLMMEFGERFTVHVVGVAKMPLPPSGGSQLGAIEMAFKISLDPEKGLFSIDAVLTENSYLFSKDATLTGGFAFYSWFSGPHSGDMVVTLGGYHPKFAKPSHFPEVPRLALRWQLSSSLQFKGELYQALTTSMIMAGGRFEAVYKSGNIKAWFNASIDVLISWLPFYYDASFSITIGADIDLGFFSISFEVGVDLQIWGPSFAGKAKINAGASFTINFGNSGGNESSTWQEFRNTYLPERANDTAKTTGDDSSSTETNDFCKVTVTEGFIAECEDTLGNLFFTVQPDSFEISVDSQLPLNNIVLNNSERDLLSGIDASSSYDEVAVATSSDLEGSGFSVSAMGGKESAEVTDWSMTIDVDGPLGMKFGVSSVEKPMPLALYGDSLSPDVGSSERTKSLLSGVLITAAITKPPGFTEPVDADEFKFQDVVENDPYWQWGSELNVEVDNSSSHDQVLKDTLQSSGAQTIRETVRNHFSYSNDKEIIIDQLASDPDSAFIGTPQAMKEVA
jgi:hypothetical protein